MDTCFFLDEKIFTTKINTSRMRVKRFRSTNNNNNLNLQFRHSNLTQIQINTLCFINYNSPVLLKLISDNFNSALFREEIREVFEDTDGEVIIYMDNCSLHLAPPVLQFFIEHPNIKIIRTSPVSPDLNCIENIFSLIDRRLDFYLLNNFIGSTNELYSKILEFAAEIPITTINKLIDSMPNRINKCRDLYGNHTGY